MRTLFAKKTIWVYLAIGMVLLPCMPVNDTLGSGPTCPPCANPYFNGSGWACGGCVIDCGNCFKCDTSTIPPSCADKCDSLNCKYCPDCSTGCQVCGGEPNQKCCNGTCYPKCKESSTTTPCSSTNNTPCLGCVGLFGNCHSACYSYHYLNTPIYACDGGCPDECDFEDPDPDCYEVYYCENYIHYTFAECTNWSETGPVPLDCYEELVTPWSCTRCREGALYRTETCPSRRCH